MQTSSSRPFLGKKGGRHATQSASSQPSCIAIGSGRLGLSSVLLLRSTELGAKEGRLLAPKGYAAMEKEGSPSLLYSPSVITTREMVLLPLLTMEQQRVQGRGKWFCWSADKPRGSGNHYKACLALKLPPLLLGCFFCIFVIKGNCASISWRAERERERESALANEAEWRVLFS